ncbi:MULTISPECIES: hypothetical protein [unclassified Novosphingobium]|uniref:hypothetical protein n=1 Tax=unclassified Novosphingobium TaxID=2644732 RepID=UPI0025D3A787|nr:MULTISPECIES: hypothetical protein [unclassified Novosphingobium]HQS70033.1 hypothetical protein [Novosphingobium sp.]
MDQTTQLKYFTRAVALLGGQQATSRALNMSDRSVRMLLAGNRRLHAGILEDLGRALIAHADECRALERKLSPAFASNRTEAQAKPPLHDGKQRERSVTTRMQIELAQARDLGFEPVSWTISASAAKAIDRSYVNISRSRTLFGLPFDIVDDVQLDGRPFGLHTTGE